VKRSLEELPLIARSMAEGFGHHVATLFFGNCTGPFVRCAAV
jgi:hypothetical protein